MTVVGVVGSSARAAVHSLARAGFSAWSIDQFRDRDLKRIAPGTACPPDRYPAAVPELAAQFPSGPIIYTGGLENHPQLIAELAAARELWGNPPAVLARVRDPFVLFPALNRAGFTTPRLAPADEPCPRERRWLRKPYSSGGGIGIRFTHPDEVQSSRHYFQELIEGVPMSAVFVNDELLGATEQLIGCPWVHAHDFTYCGNVGPLVPPRAIAPLGKFLSARTGLRGVWGLDFVLRGDEPVVLEVNPRYTAAVEVLEHAHARATPPAGRPTHPPAPSLQGGGEQTFGWERVSGARHATSEATPSLQGGGRGVGSSHIGKAIYYAPHALVFPATGPWDADLDGAFDPWRLPQFADIPEPNSAIQTGWPVLTFFATGSTPAEVRERLQSRAGELDRLFAERSP